MEITATPIEESEFVVKGPESKLVALVAPSTPWEASKSDLLSRVPENIIITEESQVLPWSNLLRSLTDMATMIEDEFKEPARTTHAAHKAVTKMRARHLDPLKDGIQRVKFGLGLFQRQLEEQRAREAEALRKREREIAEAKAREEAAAAVPENCPPEAVETLAQTIVEPPPAIVEPKKVRLAGGLKTRKVHKARVDDMPKFLLHLAAELPSATVDSLITVNQGALNRLAKGAPIPGVTFYTENQIST